MDKMSSDILNNLENPAQLEKLYRHNKSLFKTEFNLLYPNIRDSKLAGFWKERLSYEGTEISWGSARELFFIIALALAAGFLAKLPALFHLNQEAYYTRNIGFIVFPVLTVYFGWRNGLSLKSLAFAGLAFLAAGIYINMLPANDKSDTLMLACMHLPLFLWGILGFTYVEGSFTNYSRRLDFLRYNGELVILCALILISGGILTGITIGLFSVIGLHIEKFYFDNIVVVGLAAVPVVATFITQTNPQLVNKVSPVIARIFSPLVLITLVIYLVAILFSGKDPYNDREFLMVFNLMLIGVMALIFFSVAETSKLEGYKAGNYILFALSLVTIIVNGIAFSAILFRISEWGITPNRLAVLGANVLMLANLLVIAYRLLQTVSKKSNILNAGNAIAMFLPAYLAWTAVVVFLFPLIFGYK